MHVTRSRSAALLLLLACTLPSTGCLTTLGAFRGARALPKGQTEVGVRGVTNGYAIAGVANVRHGAMLRTDVEGLVLAGRGEGDATGLGAGLGITHQLPDEYDWLALGVHGVASTYAHMVGGRLLVGKNPYLGFETNAIFQGDVERFHTVLAGFRVGEALALEVGAFPIPGEDDFWLHIGLGLLFPAGGQ